MAETGGIAEARARYEEKAAALVGRKVLEVEYWDVYNFGSEPRTWDYGDWHHAVIGVDLLTDRGPASLFSTDTFFPHGLEVSHQPIEATLEMGPEGPEGWGVTDHPLWQSRLGSPVRATAVHWEPLEVGPAIRMIDGARVEESRNVQVPEALRLDFDSGPVWLVAAQPAWPDPHADWMFVGGDEVVVVFSSQRMRKMGFTDASFLAESAIN